MGRRNRARANQGKAWEATLEHWHRTYLDKGWGWVIRTPPPVKVLGRVERGTFRACFESNGPPDYAGVVQGVAVAFDAKSTAQDRFSLAMIDKHQALHLECAQFNGAFAFIALLHPSGSWVMPWSELGKAWQAWQRQVLFNGRAKPGTASLTAQQIVDIGLPFTNTGWVDHVTKPEGTWL